MCREGQGGGGGLALAPIFPSAISHKPGQYSSITMGKKRGKRGGDRTGNEGPAAEKAERVGRRNR